MGLQFSESASEELNAIVAKYPRKEAALLPALHLAQREFNHLSIEVQAMVAKTLDIPPVRVHEVTTFYEMFHQHAEGQFHLELCTNISCHLAGADSLVCHAKKKLGIEVGHQSEDGVFGLMEAECLASCGSGPMMRVGDDYYEHLTPEAFDHLLDEFKKQAPGLNGRNYFQGESGPHTGPVSGFEPNEAKIVAQPTDAAKDDAPAEDEAASGDSEDGDSSEISAVAAE
jgi:NADH-quinone oxidoreductase E subunit